jgi:quinohemoprotein ethanol dehydrogenase
VRIEVVRTFACFGFAVVCLVACEGPADLERQAPSVANGAAGSADAARIAGADAEPDNWFTTGRSFSEERYSPLSGITADNVKRLGFAWQYDLRTARGLEATPIVVDGMMFTSSTWSKVYALHAATGREIWSYDPKVPGAWARRACCDVVNRGVAVYRGRVYVGTLDGRLVALDAATGNVLWERDTLVDRSRFYTITGAPRIAAGRIVIGNSGAEAGVRGYVSAYDALSGEMAWRFFTVPGPPDRPYEHPELEEAAKTWDPASRWDTGLGGTAWDAMAFDPKLGLLYVGTGNANPYPISLRSPRGGDNLYVSSILAIDAATGRLAWHYQTTPGDSWDFTATQHLILADLDIAGRRRNVIMQAPKNGFFYVLDRQSGELLSAGNYVDVNWASRIDAATGRPVFTGEGDYARRPRVVKPSTYGGHNWQPMAYSPETRLVYIPTIDSANHFSVDAHYTGYVAGRFNVALGEDPHDGAEELPWRGALKAWDPVRQREVWRIDYPFPYNGGLLATAGNLVFQGTTDGFLKAYTADEGELAAEVYVGTGIMAAPMSYRVDGVQYIAVMAGFGGAQLPEFAPGSAARRHGNAGRIVAFRLDGGPVPVPPEVGRDEGIPEPPPRRPVQSAALERGRKAFFQICGACHRDDDQPSGYPNLLRMAAATHRSFDDIVLNGVLSARGMAGFGDLLDTQAAAEIHAYLIDRAHDLRARSENSPNSTK